MLCGVLGLCDQSLAAQAGRLDPSFGIDGKVVYQLGAGGPAAASQVSAVARQRDGRLVIGGFATDADGNRQFMVARLRSNGALDPSFGNDGKVIVQLDSGPNPSSEVRALAIQRDGEIVVGGFTAHRGSGFLIVRLTTAGELDRSFGQGGVVEVPMPASGPDRSPSAVSALALQPDGKIVAAGAGAADPALAVVARLFSDGRVDPSFGTDGVLVTLPGHRSNPTPDTAVNAFALALQPDGEILVAGQTPYAPLISEPFVLRLNGSDGSVDPSFGAGGVVLYSPFNNENLSFGVGQARGLALQADGGIIFVGGMFGAEGSQSSGTGIVGRLLPGSGALDNSFGAGGTDIFGPFESMGLWAVALQRHGHIVVGGDIGDGDFVLAQMNGADGSLDRSFGTGGEVTGQLDTSGQHLSRVTALALEPDGKIVAAGHTGAGFAGSKLFVLRLVDPSA